MGTGVFGGMIFATFIAPIFVPLFFTLLARTPKPKEVVEAQHENRKPRRRRCTRTTTRRAMAPRNRNRRAIMRERERTGMKTITTRTGAAALGVAFGAALALAGCAVGPDYKRPGTALPADFDAVAAVDANAASATITSDWWKVYNDPLLNDLVGAAITGNPNMRLAIARIDEARAALRETNAAFFPEVDYAGLGARSRSGAAGGSSGNTTTTATGSAFYGNLYRLDAGVSYELDLWGKLRRASESSRASLCCRPPTRAT